MAIAALAYGDLLMSLDNQTKPYEKRPGDSAAAVARWQERLSDLLAKGKGLLRARRQAHFQADCRGVRRHPRLSENKLKVGIVGGNLRQIFRARQQRAGKVPVRAGLRGLPAGHLEICDDMAENSVIGYELYGGSAVIKTAAAAARRYLSALNARLQTRRRAAKTSPITAILPKTRRLASGGHRAGLQDGRGLAAARRDDGADRKRVRQHRLRAALRLPAEPIVG